jgi:hypothetical protein
MGGQLMKNISGRCIVVIATLGVLTLFGAVLARDLDFVVLGVEQDCLPTSESASALALGVFTTLRQWTSPARTRGKRICLVGDHQHYHCGSAAVSRYIRATLAEHGFTVSDRDYDVMLVNGEGSMCFGCPPFHTKMQRIKTALKQGVSVHLVNTIWQQNPYHYDNLLPKLSSVVTRESLSHRELRTIHGIDSQMFLDFSFFAPLNETGNAPNHEGRVVVTDFAKRRSRDFVRYPNDEFVYTDMRSIAWPDFVLGLKTASVLVTGRHHGVYAALRARIPFVAMPGNSHKIEGLIASANIPIPLVHSFDEIPAAVDRVSSLEPLYRELFDWAEAQPKWTAESLIS